MLSVIRLNVIRLKVVMVSVVVPWVGSYAFDITNICSPTKQAT